MKKRQLAVFICVIMIPLICRLNACASPGVSAKAAILTELSTGRVLYEKNPNERLPMASTTKIMTALVAIERGGERLDELTEISASAAGVEGSSMYLEQGERMTLRELLYGLMLPSGNDAAVAIAENIGGSVEEFVKMMNDRAAELGLGNTSFANPNGLPDDNHYSSAKDMAKMTEAAMKNPVFAEIAGTESYKISGDGKAFVRTLTNHNKLLRMYDGCIGVKTGFTKAAGRCLVSCAERDGMTLVCVTLNAPDDWNDHIQMFNYGFDNYRMVKLAAREEQILSIPVDNSYEPEAAIYPERDIYYPLSEDEAIERKTETCDRLTAPVRSGETVGKLIFTLPEGGETEVPLATVKSVEEIPAVKRLGQKLGEYIIRIFSDWIEKI